MNEQHLTKPFDDRCEAELAILSALPSRVHAVARLRLLADPRRPPVVTVIGKYNHGKSRLLNELIGHNAFAVADKRETVALSAQEHGGVRWLDAPGLDADVGEEDDGLALRATWLESDIRLFVHALKEGELDASERTLLASLRADGVRSKRQTVLVLAQVDQLADDEQVQKVRQVIEMQAPAFETYPVSSTRYRLGIEGGKSLMVARSGIPTLQAALQKAVAHVPQARQHETAVLLYEILGEIQHLQAVRQAAADALRLQQSQQSKRFNGDLTSVLQKVATDIQAMLDAPGPDHSLNPDSFANQFEITPGKLERNRLQVGYSKACIEVNAILIRHGVTELPVAQQTAARGLNNVMVAVLGVYVKYRKDLRQIFCEAAGRERMHHDFSRYFELSADRIELSATIATAELNLGVAKQALRALGTLRSCEMSASPELQA